MMNQYSGHYSQSLIVEASFNDTDRVKNAIENGANPNAQDNIGYTALMKTGSGFVAEYLLRKGANPDIINHRQETALHIHARNGHQYIVDALIKANANINAITNVNKNALMVTEDLNVIKLLLNAGINANQVNHNGETSLMSHCLKNNIEIASYLIDNKAGLHYETCKRPNVWSSLREVDKLVNGALIYAQDAVLIEKLIRAGADPSGIDNVKVKSVIEYLKLIDSATGNLPKSDKPEAMPVKVRARI